MKKIWTIIKKIICGIGFFLTTVFAVLFVKDKYKYDKRTEEEIKNDKENEIKKTDAADLVADSPNQDDIQQSIEQQKEDFRKRIRDRLKQKI